MIASTTWYIPNIDTSTSLPQLQVTQLQFTSDTDVTITQADTSKTVQWEINSRGTNLSIGDNIRIGNPSNTSMDIFYALVERDTDGSEYLSFTSKDKDIIETIYNMSLELAQSTTE